MLAFANISQLCRICLRHLRQNMEQQHPTTAATVTTASTHRERNKPSYNLKVLPHLAKLLTQFFAIDIFQQPETFPSNICALCYNAIEYFQQLCDVAEQSNEMLLRLTITLPVVQAELPVTASVVKATHPDVNLASVPIIDVPEAEKEAGLLPPVKDEPLEIDDQLYEVNGFELDQDVSHDLDDDDNDDDHADEVDEDTTESHSVADAAASNADQDQDADADAVNKRKLLACQQCGKQVYKLPYLEAHIRSVHEGHPKPFLCRNCDKAFTRYEQLRSHMRNVHPAAATATAISNAELDLICEQCNRKYSTKNALGEHLKRHAQEKPHICEHCGVAKVTRTELLTHLRIHNPDWEKFKCKQCPQLFRHKSAISRHVRVVHEGQRRFQCGHCHKRFGTHASQLRHERLHIDTF